MRKVEGVLLAAAMALSIGLFAAPAGAAAGPGCGALTSKVVAKSTVITLSKCTPTSATGGSGGGTFTSSTSKSGSLNVTITWTAGHGTTKGLIKFVTATTKGKCPTGTGARFTITGSITGGTGTAVKTIKAGQKVTASVCSGKTLSLEPGTTLAL
ncbi:MAG TPA: hypothetical protein VK771_01215 [Acidimicrobiia bacterium]|nr:hypothetical protein [Acidimicrobiia bacterium]